ncbi:carbonic anhydrase [Gloeobacter kilaueensis]|uniref:carbonic anhydrase n=1 Tax=Gloeobacter kilaueensis (strain ATCC BAA-2537 / CCAP 1431/1 / ULC 316 / JS1) TaxID=1183438 RepID=U5QN92_GLOK1|nr:carbonic anhydrase [Gloeobacter kilaueensis]AGY60457.1 carbonic anhydrase [Gloeobacter kilaueensis JS1]
MHSQSHHFSRRTLIQATATGLFATYLGLKADPAAAVTDLTAAQALQRLKDGNKRWVNNKLEHPDLTTTRLKEVAKGQNPFVAVLSCADSRVPSEIVFDQGLGDIFVTRVAGNFLDDNILGSLEFATSVLGAPLIVVMGHSRCGAVQAASKAVTEGTVFPGHLADFVDAIKPAVLSVKDQKGDLVDNAIKANVLRNVEKIKLARPIIAKLVDDNKVKVVGARYELDTGEVVFFE